VRGSPSTFALGDVSLAQAYDGEQGASFPATAQVAFQQADYVAWNLWAAINGRQQLPFRCGAGRAFGASCIAPLPPPPRQRSPLPLSQRCVWALYRSPPCVA
jgi:NADH:ubiquinone reductase (non-electrogenic)